MMHSSTISMKNMEEKEKQRTWDLRSKNRDQWRCCQCILYEARGSNRWFSAVQFSVMPPHNLSLKQRLAALSIAPSAPTSPNSFDSPLTSPTGLANKRNKFFVPPWGKRAGPDPGFQNGYHQQENGRDILQEVMGKMIFQAGVDFE